MDFNKDYTGVVEGTKFKVVRKPIVNDIYCLIYESNISEHLCVKIMEGKRMIAKNKGLTKTVFKGLT